MKALIVVLSLAVSVAKAISADTQSASLALEVHARVYPVSSFGDGVDRILVVRCLLRNIGTQPLTIPTQTEKARPTLALRHPSQEFVAYSVTVPVIEGEKVRVSQFTFLPVTLEPGEAAKLPTYVRRQKGATIEIPSEARVIFEVDSEMAGFYGWWSGQLDVTAKVEEETEAQPGATDNPGDAQ